MTTPFDRTLPSRPYDAPPGRGAHGPAPADETELTLGPGERAVVPLAREEARVVTRPVETGRVRITKTVAQREQAVSAPLVSERVRVERVPVGRTVDKVPPVRQEGDTTVVPVVEEVLVVARKILVREEIRITRERAVTQSPPQRVTLRSEQVRVERLDPRPEAPASGLGGRGPISLPPPRAERRAGPTTKEKFAMRSRDAIAPDPAPPRPNAPRPEPPRDDVLRRDLARADLRFDERGQVSIPVVREELHVSKRAIDGGGVHVESHMVEEPVEQDVSLREEHVRVERRAVDRPATLADFEGFREGSFDVVERSERAVVEKNARVVEEIIIGKEVTQRTEHVVDRLRHSEVAVRDLGGQHKGSKVRHWEDYEGDFRNNFSNVYGAAGGKYEELSPAYRYGYDLATAKDYYGRDWATFEVEARDRWERQNPGTWDRVKDGVRYAWAKVTGRA